MTQANRINFTKQTIDALPLPPHGKRAEYRDSKVVGLSLRVTHTGAKTFSILKWVSKSRSPSRVTLGKYPGQSIEQARAQALRTLGEVAAGVDPREQRQREKQRLTFAQVFDDYYQRHALVHKKSAKADRKTFDNQIAPVLGARPIGEITRADVAALHSRITRKGTPIAANRVLALVSGVFGWAMDAGMVESNPAQRIRKNKEQSRDRFVRKAEVGCFMRAVHAEPNAAIRDFVLLCLFTGQRRSNVLAMRWPDVSMADGMWRIPITKNGTPHTIPLITSALAVLEERWPSRESAFVFPGPGKSGHLQEPKKGWQRILCRAEAYALLDAHPDFAASIAKERPNLQAELLSHPTAVLVELQREAVATGIDTSQARLTDLHMHDLRRTLASWQAMTNASTSIIGKTLNHKSPQSTAVYARLDISPVAAAMETAVGAFLSAADPSPTPESKKMEIWDAKAARHPASSTQPTATC